MVSNSSIDDAIARDIAQASFGGTQCSRLRKGVHYGCCANRIDAAKVYLCDRYLIYVCQYTPYLRVDAN